MSFYIEGNPIISKYLLENKIFSVSKKNWTFWETFRWAVMIVHLQRMEKLRLMGNRSQSVLLFASGPEN